MRVQNQKYVRRHGQALVQVVLGLATVVAGGAGYLLSDDRKVEWIVLPLIAAGLFGFGVALFSRARNRRKWSAAWDAYAARELDREPSRGSVPNEALAMAGTN